MRFPRSPAAPQRSASATRSRGAPARSFHEGTALNDLAASANLLSHGRALSRPSTSLYSSRKKDVDARHRRQVYAVCAKQTAKAGHDELPRPGQERPFTKVGTPGMTLRQKCDFARPI